MALPFIYVAIMIGFIFLVMGLFYKDDFMVLLAGFFITILGIYMIVHGVDSINNYVSNALSLCFVGIGAYFILTTSISMLNESF